MAETTRADGVDMVLVSDDPGTGVRTLRLNRPAVLNAMDVGLASDLHRAVAAADQAEEVRCIVIAAAGRAFCAGGDIRGWGSRTAVDGFKHLERRAQLITAIAESATPVIASVNGPAIGGGFSLALCCDLVVAAESAFFSQGFVSVGLAPDMASSYFLPRQVGMHKARELIFTGRRVSAQEAHELGIVTQLCADEDLEASTLALARSVAARSPHALSLSKRLLAGSFETSLAGALHHEAMAYGVAVTTEEHKTAVQDFLGSARHREENS